MVNWIFTNGTKPKPGQSPIQERKTKDLNTRAKLYKTFLDRQPKEAKPLKKKPDRQHNVFECPDTRQTENQNILATHRINASKRIQSFTIHPTNFDRPALTTITFKNVYKLEDELVLKRKIGSIEDVGRKTVE